MTGEDGVWNRESWASPDASQSVASGVELRENQGGHLARSIVGLLNKIISIGNPLFRTVDQMWELVHWV